jgi:hypothetical protein
MGRLKRRPSAAIVISVAALFMSLGGASYAAFIPNGSVGTAQLQNNAVTNSKIRDNAVNYKKILPSSVGIVRANTSQLQVRVGGTCGANTAIGSIDQAGKVTCNPTPGAEFGATGTATPGSSSTRIASTTLPAGSTYLAFANPNATVTNTSTATDVTITCTLTVGSNTQTRAATVETGTTAGTVHNVSIPLQQAGPAGASNVSCQASPSGGTSPTVSVTSSLNAIQTASNN